MSNIPYEVRDLEEAEYRAHPALANTDLKNAQLSLLGQQPFTPKKALREGTYLHTAILEPEKWVDLQKKLTAPQANRIGRIAATARNYPLLNELFSHPNVMIEKCVFWKDPLTGLECKAKPDLFIEGEVVLDLKTTSRNMRPAFEKQVLQKDFDRQISFYNIPLQTPIARVVGVSKTSKGRLFRLEWNRDDEYLTHGRKKAEILLQKIADDPTLYDTTISYRK